MKYDKIIKTIIGSNPNEDWIEVQGGNYIFRSDIFSRIKSYPMSSSSQVPNYARIVSLGDTFVFPYRVFYNSSLVHLGELISIDGGRAVVPKLDNNNMTTKIDAIVARICTKNDSAYLSYMRAMIEGEIGL